MDTSNHLLIWISVQLVNLQRVNKADPLCVGRRVLAFGAHHTVLGADCGMQPGCVKRPLTVLKTTNYLARIKHNNMGMGLEQHKYISLKYCVKDLLYDKMMRPY